ncbi:MAG: molybdopterin synthase sulfur carrier subunit [Gammaproteobacteria bacterium]|nr:MAG: molybdopterin synthase sulfur carrier subunit [Gammaproteobacteria bacterium]
MLMIKIIFFARLRELLEIEQLDFELKANHQNTVKDILESLVEKYSVLAEYLEQDHQLMIAVNHLTADLNKEVQSGDELAFFPPVTGG